ncbi:tryptophan 2,3-dioxygenase [Nocardia mexicana]|uniref:Tryptophan 2,3-dioxygenase n=2 Tax=Nocardia mexicana TaxID=279262 RepID=A0A370HF61_9NOCA|nr:tryptophan 2,3-dioxygenase [Nocardia mexicana]
MNALTYSDYLDLGTLLSAQNPRTPPESDRSLVLAEHFFIVTHQSCELWFKQLIIDLDAAAEALAMANDPVAAESCTEYLDRSAEILRILSEQIRVLEKLPGRHFAAFRRYLGTASGVQSRQYREIGRLLGNDRRQGRLYEEFAAAVSRAGTSITEVCRSGPAVGVFHRITESLLDIGNRYWQWKIGHVALVSKMLGDRSGSAGTAGADFLLGRITMPFPELRRLRSEAYADLDEARRPQPTDLPLSGEREVRLGGDVGGRRGP